MQDSPTYYEDGVARVLKVLKDTFGTGGLIRTYYNGQPEEIGESVLPCIMVSEGAGNIRAGATGTDVIVETVKIIVAFNKKDDLGASEDTDLTEFKLRKIVKGQDPATKQYLPQSVMYALRTHITLDDAVVESEIQTFFEDDSIGAGVNVRGIDTVTQEAVIQLTIRRLALVPVREHN